MLLSTPWARCPSQAGSKKGRIAENCTLRQLGAEVRRADGVAAEHAPEASASQAGRRTARQPQATLR